MLKHHSVITIGRNQEEYPYFEYAPTSILTATYTALKPGTTSASDFGRVSPLSEALSIGGRSFNAEAECLQEMYYEHCPCSTVFESRHVET
ncbi:hypothetical protein RB195_005432 [Necator americanus]|uniref:Laminin N-terminal domain-containing protein n=1 Tax=Necator americanus TaxID=51031 RepID=A0ABR1BQU3_NECAM